MTRDYRLVSLALLLWGLGEGLFLMFEPLYLAQLGANAVEIGAILGAAGAVLTATHIPAGYIADRWGSKQVLIAAWLLGASATTAMFFAPNLLWYTVGLMAYTVTAFVIAPLNSYLTASRGSLSMERALTLSSVLYNVGAVLSPLLGGVLGARLGLRAVYGISAGIFWLSAVLVLLLRPMPVHGSDGHSRYRPLLVNRHFLTLVGLAAFAMFAMYLAFPLTPNYLRQAHGLTLPQIGVLGSLMTVGAILANSLLGRRAPRRGFLLAQAMVGLHAILLWRGTGLIWFQVAYLLRGWQSAARSLTNAQIGRVVGPAQVGLAYGVAETAMGIALMLAPPLAGLLFARDPALPFPVSAGLVIVSLLLAWRFAPRAAATGPEAVAE